MKPEVLFIAGNVWVAASFAAPQPFGIIMTFIGATYLLLGFAGWLFTDDSPQRHQPQDVK